MYPFEQWIAESPTHRQETGLPLVSLAYAQSLDGSIATQDGKPIVLSGSESLRLTHRLRAAHDAIMVGIGTVLADDPELSVRFVQGKHPQPVILDSRLRIPRYSRLLSPLRQAPLPWIVTSQNANRERRSELESSGIRLIDIPLEQDGMIGLHSLLGTLASSGINSVMVEGGAKVICSFVAKGLADIAIITIAPILLSGYHAIPTGCFAENAQAGTGEPSILDYPQLSQVGYARLENDIIVWGKF